MKIRFPNDLTFELANISFLIRAQKQCCKLRRKTERKKPTKTPKAPMNQKKKKKKETHHNHHQQRSPAQNVGKEPELQNPPN